MMKVVRLNGKELIQPVVMEFGSYSRMVELPAAGEAFKLSGYETGGFVGIPNGADLDMVPAMVGYSFQTKFIVFGASAP